ncbi:MAG: DNA alkylation repair protein [Acidimicrobiia bacterium]|nr:DNA alkylation repair protein [Acidimicrobiia bacterium]
MATPLKDRVNVEMVRRLADGMAEVDGRFDAEAFIIAVKPRIDQLELKDRINLLADELAAGLDATSDYPAALAAVVALAEIEPTERWAAGTFAAWPLCSFVERHGVDHPADSLAAMPTLTKRWSCEFAIRPFLDNHLDLTWRHLVEWRSDEHEAVRRLVSEGTRPLLPWATRVKALTEHPELGLDLIAPLRTDPSEAVRRSVANHLNDVAKLKPELVTATLTRWAAGDGQPDDQVVRHGLRTLIKRGDPAAMALLGFDTSPEVTIETFTCEPASITLGDTIQLTATIRSTSAHDQRLVVDYVIHHPTATGAISSKVFKWTNLRLDAGATVTLEKRRAIKSISTRIYQPGRHRVELQVAGRALANADFDLAVD